MNVASARASKAPLSLIILTYNEEVNIPHTLDNAKEWAGEIVIVDSLSTDGTLDILKSFESRGAITLVSAPDGGLAEALNKGVRIAGGDVLGLLNAVSLAFLVLNFVKR